MIHIENLIPHRHPFLLIDQVTDLSDQSIAAQTKIRADDPLFSIVCSGHYPGNPIVPGVLLCEMIFQAGAILLCHRLKENAGDRVPVLTGIDRVRFKQIVRPGDLVRIECSFNKQIENAFRMNGSLEVDGKLAVRLEFLGTSAMAADVKGEPARQGNWR